MRVIENVPIPRSKIVAFDLTESVGVWSASALYLTTDRARISSTNKIYESVIGHLHKVGSGTVTISLANPAVVTMPGHGLANGQTVGFSTTGALPEDVFETERYVVTNRTDDTFQLAWWDDLEVVDTSAGSQSGVHKLIFDPNIQYAPNDSEEDGSHWIEVGPDNVTAMFDTYSSTKSERAEEFSVTIRPAEPVDTMSFFGLEATSLTVTETDPTDGLVFDETFDLNDYSNVDDYYDWFFAPPVRRTKHLVQNIPPYSAADIEITVELPGDTARCGKVVPGLIRDLGVTLTGPETDQLDHSLVEFNEFGGLESLTERGSRDRMVLRVKVDREDSDEVERILKARRATPTTFVGDDTGTFESLLIDGLARRWSLSREEYLLHDLSITVEGFN